MYVTSLSWMNKLTDRRTTLESPPRLSACEQLSSPRIGFQPANSWLVHWVLNNVPVVFTVVQWEFGTCIIILIRNQDQDILQKSRSSAVQSQEVSSAVCWRKRWLTSCTERYFFKGRYYRIIALICLTQEYKILHVLEILPSSCGFHANSNQNHVL